MHEALLHFLWQFQLFDRYQLNTTADQLPVQVQKTGYHNHDAGPDFLNARIKVGDTLWAGNVEIHLKASDWFRHGHHNDPSYANVVLHVVLRDDRKDKSNDALGHIPCIELENRVSHSLLSHYQYLLNNQQWIPCADQFHKLKAFTVKHWLNRLQIERLAVKRELVDRLLAENHFDWQETLHQLLARGFGFKINAEPFERLARLTPYRIIAKHADQLFQLEALLLGQAGLLPDTANEDYPNQLNQEYRILQQKYNLKPMAAHEWNRLRLRPANFPPIRIAQLATFYAHVAGVFNRFLSTDDLNQIRSYFQVKASDYWDDHYWPDKVASSSKPKKLSKPSIDNLLTNTVIPFIFSYGQNREEPHLIDRALSFLEYLPAESNNVLKQWEALGAPNQNAGHSQALLHLKKRYCDEKQCLSCEIGTTLLRGSYNL